MLCQIWGILGAHKRSRQSQGFLPLGHVGPLCEVVITICFNAVKNSTVEDQGGPADRRNQPCKSEGYSLDVGHINANSTLREELQIRSQGLDEPSAHFCTSPVHATHTGGPASIWDSPDRPTCVFVQEIYSSFCISKVCPAQAIKYR